MKTMLAALIAGFVAAAALAQGPTPWYQYSAKIVCGTTAAPLIVAAKGQYFSEVNVHNPSRYRSVTFRKKFAVADPNERGGKVSPFFSATLGIDESLQIDCGDVFKLLGLPPTYLDAFAVIESPTELDVVTVYTAGWGAANDVSSIHTERVPPRRLETCNPLNLDLTTGVAPWTVSAESVLLGPLGRPASVYGVWQAPSHQIGGMPTISNSDVGRWWEFQLCFCLCSGFQNVKLNLTAAFVDDRADFDLNGPIGVLNFGTATTGTLNPISTAATQNFRPGLNCLKVKLTNLFPNGADIAFIGSITGADAACPK
jgi:hypothetical protein